MKVAPRAATLIPRAFSWTAIAVTAFFAVAAAVCEASSSIPLSSSLRYVGNAFDPFYAIGNVPISGPITGRIEFSVPLVAGATLTQADVSGFSFSSDGLTWTSGATFQYMKFVIGPSLLPTNGRLRLSRS